jgi:hypothetical protein
MLDPTNYEIYIEEILDKKWAAHFQPFRLTSSEAGTVLSGEVHDQAELFGVLLKIRDLGLRLISVNPVPPG